MASDPTWPALAWEQHEWRATVSPDLVSRKVRQRHRGPYRAAVPPKIANAPLDLAAEVLAQADEATQAVARFDAGLAATGLPFTATLLRSESASSSQIENLTSSARAIAMAGIGERSGANARLIIANVRAMHAAIEMADRLDASAILAMHKALLSGDDPDNAGRWRREQVWVGGTGFGPHQAEFVPPHHERIPRLIDDLIHFVRRDDVPALVSAALAHAQFETIHPFVDGNGRTGRALLHAVLRARGVMQDVTVPLSAGLLADTNAYFDALTTYRAGDPSAIVRQLADAAFAAVANGRILVDDLQAIRRRWSQEVSARADSAVWRIADLLLRQPVIDAATVQRELGITSANAHRALRRLVDAGVLGELTGKQRRRLWQSAEVITALDDFAARASRRSAR